MNKVMYSGIIGSIGSMKVSGEVKTIRFSVGSSYSVKVNDEWEDRMNFSWFTAFGKKAEYINSHIGKNDQVEIEAHLSTQKKEDDKGNAKYFESIVVDQFTLVRRNKGNADKAAPAPTPA